MDKIDFLLDHARNPRHFYVPEHFDMQGEAQNLSCGDSLRIYVTRTHDSVTKMSFTGIGCAVCLASVSRLTEEARGRQIDEILNWGLPEVEGWIGVSVSAMRSKCALLGLRGLQNLFR